jgi:YYY domain-containing protein
MVWSTVIWLILAWYVTVQMVMLAALPLTLRVLRALPDRGYSFAKICGILLVGVVLWLGVSYGLLRNERGGAWLALLGVGVFSWLVGYADLVGWWRALRNEGLWRAVLTSEVIFAVAFVAWAVVRAYDPRVDHTEQPMDLMFMNSIWTSATFPPQDAWLAGYGISYYYLGYWLLTSLARLAATPPALAYNLGQAIWYGYLWVGCFGVVMNLLVWRFGREAGIGPFRRAIPGWSLVGGLLGGIAVAFVGNLQVIFEWLYAQGVNLSGIIRWIDVNEFPENASQSGQWFIGNGWWWWRSSRVIQDLDLAGNHVEVIDEFPMFSYLLGDNHPHVLAMPVVLLVIGLALNLLFLFSQCHGEVSQRRGDEPNRLWQQWLPLTGLDAAVYLLAVGSLIFLNTWDFPPYWLLLVVVIWFGNRGILRPAMWFGGALVLGTVLLYLPYFLTAQSQAGGIIPNLFNPTRLPQFLAMFGGFLPALIGLVVLGWRFVRPSWSTVASVAAVVIGLPIAFLVISTAISSTGWGQARFVEMELPPGATSYTSLIVARWLAEPWTLLMVGLLLTALLAVLFMLLRMPLTAWADSADLVFVLFLAAIGLGLVYAPEIAFLRDFFGTRMNTIFKFYYQGWLLFALASAYMITIGLRRLPKHVGIVEGLGLVSLLLIMGAMIFPFAGVYGKTGGFSSQSPTFDSMAWVEERSADVMAAAQWVQLNTTADAVVLEGVGNSYNANTNLVSTMTGRPTLLGWEGHERQWRGEAYGEMSEGRPEAVETIYRQGSPEEIAATLAVWGIDYVFVGPVEIERYGITQMRVDELGEAMEPVFERGQVRIFRRRES